jgi:hypothetical protein
MNARNIFWNCEGWLFESCRNGLPNNTRSGSAGFFDSDAHRNGNGEWDAVCESCDAPLEIFHKRCPVCLGRKLFVPDIAYYEVDSLGIYNYTCEGCGRSLYAYVPLDEGG